MLILQGECLNGGEGVECSRKQTDYFVKSIIFPSSILNIIAFNLLYLQTKKSSLFIFYEVLKCYWCKYYILHILIPAWILFFYIIITNQCYFLYGMTSSDEICIKTIYWNTVCPRSSYPVYIVSYFLKRVTTSWTHSWHTNRQKVIDYI